MKQQKSFIILSPGFPKDEKDTSCLPSQQIIVKCINRLFPHIHVIIISFHYPYRKEKYKWFDNTVFSISKNKNHKLLRPLLWLRVYQKISAICKVSEPIGILSFWCHETALVGSIAARQKGIKHFIWAMGQDAKKSNILIPYLRLKSQNVIALSDFLADEFSRNHGIRPGYVIPNGIDQQMFGQSVVAKDIDILAVGSLSLLKQYTLVIDAAVHLVAVKPDVKVTLVGEGPEELNIRKKIRDLGLEGNMQALRKLPHGEVLRLMKRSKILLHPSQYEGYSTVCLEALYAGCHVISFTAATKEQVAHWHIVKDLSEMITKCRDLLFHEKDFSAVLVNTMDESAKKIIDLFYDRDK